MHRLVDYNEREERKKLGAQPGDEIRYINGEPVIYRKATTWH